MGEGVADTATIEIDDVFAMAQGKGDALVKSIRALRILAWECRTAKQVHDEYHDWIEIRRGRCPGCGKTFTFLPLFSFPYTHYSLLARSGS